MAIQHVIVDGSNIATEGRTAPSLAQLDEAVRSFLEEYGHPALTVVVDATFGHRIAASEQADFEAGIVNGELVTPPAGAIGRGDAFVLQIAAKADATIFSNDSFQEFHGTYDWLFDEGRLIGGKPVPNVGWVFVPRTPVRGPTSRRSTRETRTPRRAAKAVIASPEASAPMPVPTKPPPGPRSAATPRSRGRASAAQPAADDVVVAAVPADIGPVSNGSADTERLEDAGASAAEGGSSRGRRRRASTSSASPINEPMAFLAFVSEHPIGSVVEGTVDRFSSHGAYVISEGAQCYIPLKAMADPPPTKAREVLTPGEVRSFVVTSFDPPRRGIDVAFADQWHEGDGEPLDSTPAPQAMEGAAAIPATADGHDDAADETTASAGAVAPAEPVKSKKRAPDPKAAPRTSTADKKPVKKATATKKATAAKKATTAKKATATKEAGAKEAAATKKTTATRKTAAATKEPAVRKKAAGTDRAATTKAAPTTKGIVKKAGRASKGASPVVSNISAEADIDASTPSKSRARRAAAPTTADTAAKAPVSKVGAASGAAGRKATAPKKATATRKTSAKKAPVSKKTSNAPRATEADG